ncbi:MAG TPA: MBL fold metallo-hydrolase [Methylomirabilota bacterium]|nr:MBL fold metallo-hydrolase [Methylomirabilota bacterium]
MPDPLRLTWIGHATVLIESGGHRFLTDPFLRDRLGPLRRRGPSVDLDAIGRVDAVLLSHAHPDHFDRRSLRRLEGDPSMIVPAGLGRTIERMGFTARELTAGEGVEIGTVRVVGVPARHGRWPRHPSAAAMGFLVEGSPSVYFAGDTSSFAGLGRALAGRVDVALLPIGSWGPHSAPWHLGPRGAARLAAGIGARVVVPIHWGTLYPAGLARVWNGPLDAPAKRFLAASAALAPRTEPRVLGLGEATIVEHRPG